MGATAELPSAALCAGKDCRKRAEFPKLCAALAGHCEVIELSCVGICKGPVVVANPGSDRPIVFSGLRTKQHRRDILRLIVGGRKPSQRLRGREVSGTRRVKTIRKVRRTLPRSA